MSRREGSSALWLGVVRRRRSEAAMPAAMWIVAKKKIRLLVLDPALAWDVRFIYLFIIHALVE